MTGLTAVEMAEHLESVLTITPTWAEDRAHLDPVVQAEYAMERGFLFALARSLAAQLDMEPAIGPVERSEISGQGVYTWPLQPLGFREPILLPFQHGWSKAWSWPEHVISSKAESGLWERLLWAAMP